MRPDQTVTAFIDAVTSGDMGRAADLVAEDLVYENLGFGATSFEDAVPAIKGPSAMVEFLAQMQDAEWVVHRQIASGDLVVNERTDRFTFGEARIELTVVGVFEVVDGKITIWRDYFDMHTMLEQMSGT